MKPKIAKPLRKLAVPIDTVRAASDNPRLHSAENLVALKTSLARYGQQKPIVINAGGEVIAGAGTLAAARGLGWDSIAATVSDLKGAEALGYRIADNRTGESSAWDPSELGGQLQQLADVGADALAASGFGPDDLTGSTATSAAEIARIEDLAISASPPVTWILLAVPIHRYAEARKHIAALEKISDLNVEVSRLEDPSDG